MPGTIFCMHGSAHEMKVGAADRRHRDPDDRIRRLFDLGIRHIIDGDLVNAPPHNSFHDQPQSFRNPLRLPPHSESKPTLGRMSLDEKSFANTEATRKELPDKAVGDLDDHRPADGGVPALNRIRPRSSVPEAPPLPRKATRTARWQRRSRRRWASASAEQVDPGWASPTFAPSPEAYPQARRPHRAQRRECSQDRGLAEDQSPGHDLPDTLVSFRFCCSPSARS